MAAFSGFPVGWPVLGGQQEFALASASASAPASRVCAFCERVCVYVRARVCVARYVWSLVVTLLSPSRVSALGRERDPSATVEGRRLAAGDH